jgi:hypothetical protein
MFYGAATGLWYCIDADACDRRMLKRLRELAKREGVIA